MIEFARPGFLLVGGVAALVPLLLHLIAQRPPDRAPLPTLRFLRRDPRTALRLRRRPDNLLLLLLRMLLLLLLGAAFAEPLWRPRAAGTVQVVLLERGAAAAGVWEEALGEARRLLLTPEGEAGGELVLFDSAAIHLPRERLTAAFLDSLAAAGPGSAPPDYSAALRAIPAVAAELGASDSIRVTLLSSPRWSGWRPGLAQQRRAAWPGALQIPALQRRTVDTPPPASPAEAGAAWVLAPPGEGRFVEAALGAMGLRVQRQPLTAVLEDDEGSTYLVLGPVPPPVERALAERVQAGATVVFAGQPAAVGVELPWEPEMEGEVNWGGALFFGPALVLDGAAGRVLGAPRPGAREIAAWEDGRAAAVAERRGAGCVVFVATALEGGTLPLAAGYPHAVDQLARGCERTRDDPLAAPSMDDHLPLDAGALRVLRAEERPPVIASAALAAAVAGVPLVRWVLLAALGTALLETLLAYGRRRAR
ncbi:MAG: BatA domain-containing protein [Longimicrobiaceae bacterium]